jgi:peptidoglycan/xylan/chitin deacetylase (PgdA/CDA1 family)
MPAQTQDLVAHGVMFHHFHGGAHLPGQGSITAGELGALIDFLDSRHVLDARQWLAKAEKGNLQPDDLCLTFDDTLLCQYEVAVPVLRRLHMTAMFFVNSGVIRGQLDKLEIYRHVRMNCFATVEDFYSAFDDLIAASPYAEICRIALRSFDPSRYLKPWPFYTDLDRRFRYLRDEVLGPTRYEHVMDTLVETTHLDLRDLSDRLWMSQAQVAALAAEGNVIGLHSHSHPTRMAALDRDAQRAQYRENLDILTEVLGEQPVCMSHPNNSYGPETLVILRNLGIRVGFRANLEQPWRTGLEFPREDHSIVMARMRQ